MNDKKKNEVYKEYSINISICLWFDLFFAVKIKHLATGNISTKRFAIPVGFTRFNRRGLVYFKKTLR